MGQPVKLSTSLILDARLTSEITERSIAGQIEFWARLGRAIEPLLQGAQSLALSRAGATMPLSECLVSINSREGRKRLNTYLQSRPYPHYEATSDTPGLLVRTDADGRRTLGRFVRRKFKVIKTLGK
jgi:hypothetical protein